MDKTTNFAQVPVWLIRSGKDISHGALRLWAVIKTYTKNGEPVAFPSQKTIAEDMGVSVRQVRTYTQQLYNAGAVNIDLRQNDDGSLGRNYVYTLAWDEPFHRQVEEQRNETSSTQDDETGEENFRSAAEENFPSTAEENFRLTTPIEHTPNISTSSPVPEVPLSSVSKLFLRDDENEEETPTAARRLRSADEKHKGDADTFQMLRAALGQKVS